MRRINHSRVVSSEGLGQLIFLTLLQEEEVESLLDCLLTLNRKEVLGLCWTRSDSGSGLTAAGRQGTDLIVQGKYLIVNGSNDGLTHSLQGSVKVYYKRI